MSRFMLTVVAIGLLVMTGCSIFGNDSGGSSKVNSQEQIVVEDIQKFFSSSDARDWDGVANGFADEVVLDYSSFGAGPAETLTPEVVVARWEAFLEFEGDLVTRYGKNEEIHG